MRKGSSEREQGVWCLGMGGNETERGGKEATAELGEAVGR